MQVERQMWFTTGDSQVRFYTVCDSGWTITRSFYWKITEVFYMQSGRELSQPEFITTHVNGNSSESTIVLKWRMLTVMFII